MSNRRTTLMFLAGLVAFPKTALAATPRVIMWDNLIPPGTPYSEIIGEGELDEANDLWNPVYDANGIKLNEELDGAYIKMPGFIIPLNITAEGVSNFMLVPYLGACIHTPPPPANQLVNTSKPVTDVTERSSPSRSAENQVTRRLQLKLVSVLI